MKTDLDVLDALEKSTARLAEQQRTTPGLADLQAELRAEYATKVEPVLAEVDSMKERAYFDRASRINLETHRADGVTDAIYLEPIRRCLAEMSSRFFAIPTSLRRIPHSIDEGPAHSEDLGKFAARIRLGMDDLGMRCADGLVADIKQHHEQLVSLLQRLQDAPRRRVKMVNIDAPSCSPAPPEVATEFNVFN